MASIDVCIMPYMLNTSFVIDIAILSAVITVGVRLIALRFSRESYIKTRKYKPGMTEYKNIYRMTSIPVLGVVAAILLLILLRVGFDVRAILQSHESERYGVLLFGSVGVILLYLLIAVVLSRVFGISYKPRRKGSDKDSWLV